MSAAEVFRQNYYHKWISYVVPQLVWHNPRAKVGSLLQSEGGEELELELAGNRWIVDFQARQFLAAGPANDMQYNFGVVAAVCEPVAGARPIEGVGVDWMPGDKDKGNPPPRTPWSPKWYRIPQARYFEDGLAQQRDDIRLQGHIWVRDKNSILEEGAKGGWNVKVVEEYAADAQLDALGRAECGAGRGEVKRHEIVGIEMWVPEYDLKADNPWGVPASPGPEKGFHGTIFTLLVDRATLVQGDTSQATTITGGEAPKRKAPGEFPRNPRPWYGSERGPYVVFGQFTVPNHTLPLGALTACEEEIRQLNTDVNIAQKMMRAYKRILLLAKGGEDEINVVKDGEHDGIYRVSGLSKEDVTAAEIGGLTDQSLAHIEFSRNNLEGTLGLNEMHSGNVSGVGTATEQAIADTAAQARFAGIQQAFEDGVKDLLWRTFWFIYEDNRVAKKLGPDAAQEIVKRGLAKMQTVSMPGGGIEERLPEPVYLGGERQGVARLPFNALSIDIQPYSMERTSEARAQQNMMNMLGIVAQLVPLAAQFPTFAWGDFAEKIGEVMNFPGLGEMFGKPGEIAAGAAQVAQLVAGGGQGGGGGIQPKVASMPQGGAGGRVQANPQRTAQRRGPAGGRSGGQTSQPKQRKAG